MALLDDTSHALIHAARELFARHGYDGASVRAITARAGANLGAVNYHFGSKRALFEAAIGSFAEGARQRIQQTATRPGTSLERIEALVRTFFAYLHENLDLPRLMMHILAGPDPIPESLLRPIESNYVTLARLIEEGQEDGSIRPGDARMMALSIAAQPIWLALARRVLREGMYVDQDRPEVRERLVESVVAFVRAGLAAHPEDAR